MNSRFRMLSAVNLVYIILVYGMHFIVISVTCGVPTISVLTLVLFRIIHIVQKMVNTWSILARSSFSWCFYCSTTCGVLLFIERVRVYS
jgi:hypothetical protein